MIASNCHKYQWSIGSPILSRDSLVLGCGVGGKLKSWYEHGTLAWMRQYNNGEAATDMDRHIADRTADSVSAVFRGSQ